MESAIWFSDEEICRLHGYDFTKRQRKILHAGISNETYFTFNMLNRDIRIGSKLKGIDIDSNDEKKAEETWLEAHPGLLPLSDE
jgi:hypothetical protein